MCERVGVCGVTEGVGGLTKWVGVNVEIECGCIRQMSMIIIPIRGRGWENVGHPPTAPFKSIETAGPVKNFGCALKTFVCEINISEERSESSSSQIHHVYKLCIS